MSVSRGLFGAASPANASSKDGLAYHRGPTVALESGSMRMKLPVGADLLVSVKERELLASNSTEAFRSSADDRRAQFRSLM